LAEKSATKGTLVIAVFDERHWRIRIAQDNVAAADLQCFCEIGTRRGCLIACGYLRNLIIRFLSYGVNDCSGYEDASNENRYGKQIIFFILRSFNDFNIDFGWIVMFHNE